MLLDRVYALRISDCAVAVHVRISPFGVAIGYLELDLGRQWSQSVATPRATQHRPADKLPIPGCGEGKSSRDPNKLSQLRSRIAEATFSSPWSSRALIKRGGGELHDQRTERKLTFAFRSDYRHVNSHVKILSITSNIQLRSCEKYQR